MSTAVAIPEIAGIASHSLPLQYPMCIPDTSQSWFSSHLMSHPGFMVLTVEDLELLAFDFEDADERTVADLAFELVVRLDSNGWEDEFLPLVDWWTKFMRRLAFRARGKTEDGNPGTDLAIAGMLKPFGKMLASAGVAMTACCGECKPGWGEMGRTLGLYRLWTRSVCEMAHRLMPDADWSGLDRLV